MSVASIKQAIRDLAGNRCQDCGRTNREQLDLYGRSLHVHRLQAGSAYTVEGCVAVCDPCHRKRHGGKPTAGKPRKLVTHGRAPVVSFRLSEDTLADLQVIANRLSRAYGRSCSKSDALRYAARKISGNLPKHC